MTADFKRAELLARVSLELRPRHVIIATISAVSPLPCFPLFSFFIFVEMHSRDGGVSRGSMEKRTEFLFPA